MFHLEKTKKNIYLINILIMIIESKYVLLYIYIYGKYYISFFTNNIFASNNTRTPEFSIAID